MKFTITIEAESISEFRWLTERLEFHEATDGTATARDPTLKFPDMDEVAAAAVKERVGDAIAAAEPAAKKKLGRPPKTAAPAAAATGGNGAAPEASPAMQQFTASKEATEPELASGKLPDLEMLRDAVTTAVRKAQRGEGDVRIMELLPAFKDRTGLAFVMNATEEHRLALYELVKDAGITIA